MKKKVTALSLAAAMAISGITAIYASTTASSPASTPASEPTVAVAVAVDAPPIAEEPAVDSKISILPYPHPYPEINLEVTPVSKEEEAKILEQLILFVKENICDTDVYENFTYNTFLNGYGKLSFNLNWNSNSGNYPYMYATIDSDKNIENFYRSSNESYDNSASKKIQLPTFTKNDALDAAVKFVKKIAPAYASDISEDFATVYVYRYSGTPSYSIGFQRVRNGMEIENETISVDVNSKGEVTSYYNSGTKNLAKEAPTTALPLRTIINSFKEKNPLELRYVTGYDYETQKNTVRLAYTTPYYNAKVIDATTGKAYTLEYKDTYSQAAMNDGAAPAPEAAATGKAESYDRSLSQVEQKAVDKHTNLLNAEDVKAILLKYKSLGFDEKMQLNYSNLNSYKSNYSDKDIYDLYVSYSYSDESGNYGYASATVNAETGEIKYYSYSDSNYPVIPYTVEEQKAYYASFLKKDDALKQAEALLKEVYKAHFSEFKLNDQTWGDTDSYGYLSYTRQVNGLPFDNNTMSVSFDRTTGKITSISYDYSSDIVFPKPDNKITASAAFDKLTAEFPLIARYKPYIETNEEKGVMYYTYNSEIEKKLALVYSYDNMASTVVDALTGDLYYIYSNEKAVYTPKEYYDTKAIDKVSDHAAAKQILAMYNLGGIEITKDFNADAAIEKVQFENMIANIINNSGYYYYGTRYYDGSMPEAATADAKAADIYMTREQAIVTIVDMLGYGDIAKINDIFKDTGDIFKGVDKSLTGYYAIVNALGLLNEVSPDTADGKLTYAGACSFIYNYILYTNAEG